MDTFKAMPNVVFPFAVVPMDGGNAIVQGGTYDLQGAVPTVVSPYNPVTVSDSTSTSFTFTTGEGHFRGPGQTIKFSIYADAGTLYLEQTGTTAGQPIDSIYDLGAPQAWNQQAANLSGVLYGGERADVPTVCSQ